MKPQGEALEPGQQGLAGQPQGTQHTVHHSQPTQYTSTVHFSIYTRTAGTSRPALRYSTYHSPFSTYTVQIYCTRQHIRTTLQHAQYSSTYTVHFNIHSTLKHTYTVHFSIQKQHYNIQSTLQHTQYTSPPTQYTSI